MKQLFSFFKFGLILLITLTISLAFVPPGYFAQPPKPAAGTAPIKYDHKSNFVIKEITIDGKNGTQNGILLTYCSNVHILKVKIHNSNGKGIFLSNCSNILIDSCFITDVNSGVYASLSTGIKVNSNQMLNMRGPYPGGNFIQFSYVYGPNNQIIQNRCEDVITGTGSNPYPGGGDGISLYKTNGHENSTVLVMGNWVRGGGTNTLERGMSGLVAGDVGGSYQDILNNIFVNTGYVGVQQQGGTHINIIGNKIYGEKKPWSGLGLGSANYSNEAASSNVIAFNEVNWIAGISRVNGRRDTVYKFKDGKFPNELPVGWKTNIVNPNMTASILPDVIITYKL